MKSPITASLRISLKSLSSLGFWALGLCLGPVLGGAIAERTTWRWIFYLMFPICGFGLVAVPYLLTLKPKKRTAQEKLSRIDWVGGILFGISGTATLVAISWGGTQVLHGTHRAMIWATTNHGLH